MTIETNVNHLETTNRPVQTQNVVRYFKPSFSAVSSDLLMVDVLVSLRQMRNRKWDTS